MEEHLSSCEECRALLEDFSEIQQAAKDLSDQSPPRDLWPGISRAIRRGLVEDPEVIRLYPGVREPSTPSRPVFRLSPVQAAAAGLVLALVSGGIGLQMGRAPAAEAPTAVEAEASWVSLVGETSPQLAGAAREVAELERLLAVHRSDLDPETVRILEKNLGVIDQAIRESVAALRADPGNQFLESHLERAIQAKADYLRTAASIMAPAAGGVG